MLILMAATLVQSLPQPAVLRVADCKPSLMLMSGERQVVSERRNTNTRRPRPCITLASTRG